jgi:DNA adenine methylase
MLLPWLPAPPLAVVNVSSVPQRSPLRYPGGKTWLVPLIQRWLAARAVPPADYYEPFAGGASVGLAVGCQGLARHVTLCELDPAIAALWQTIFRDAGGAEWLAARVERFALTPETVSVLLTVPFREPADLAFQTLVRNRVQRGGIMAPGAGLMRQGEDGRGMASRWYPATLARRIRALGNVRERFTVLQADGVDLFRACSQDASACSYLDPPYTAPGKHAGTRLYTRAAVPHAELFAIAGRARGDFLLSYDDSAAVRGWAAAQGLPSVLVPMRSTHHTLLYERLIGRPDDQEGTPDVQ